MQDLDRFKRRLEGFLEGMRTRRISSGALVNPISATAEIFYDDGVKYITNESKDCQIPVFHTHGTGNCSPSN